MPKAIGRCAMPPPDAPAARFKGYTYHRPTTVTEALSLKAKIPNACFIAGGTDVLVQMRNHLTRPSALISLRGIPELGDVELGDTCRLGAMATMSQLLARPVVRQRFPVLVEALRSLGSTQIRNVATLGGNLCNASPCANTAPALLVLDARLDVRSLRGRRVIGLDKFFEGPGETRLGPGEIVVAVEVERPALRARSAFLRKGRVAMDLAIASVAVLLEMKGKTCRTCRVAAGSVAPTPLRLREVEKLLEGKEITETLIDKARALAAATVYPITDVRSTEEYRRHLVGVYVGRALARLVFPKKGQ